MWWVFVRYWISKFVIANSYFTVAPSFCTARSSRRPMVGIYRSIAVAVSLCRVCLPPCLLEDCSVSCHALLLARKKKASSALLSERTTSWYQLVLAPFHWLCALSSWSLAFSLMPTLQTPPVASFVVTCFVFCYKLA